MAADSHTTIVGNLVEDPEVRFTNNGIAVTNLRVAVTQRVQQDGQWRDGETNFFKVNVWRGQAENLAESLGKGDRVMVTELARTWRVDSSALVPGRRDAPADSGRWADCPQTVLPGGDPLPAGQAGSDNRGEDQGQETARDRAGLAGPGPVVAADAPAGPTVAVAATSVPRHDASSSSCSA